MKKNTWILFLLLVLIVGCQRTEQLPIKKSEHIIPKPKDDFKTLNYADQISTFVAKYAEFYDTSTFVNETSATAVILNSSPYNTCIKLNFRKKTPFKDEVGLSYYQQFSLLSFQYPDSKSCNIAFDSWIAKFGTMAFPIHRMQNIAAIHASPCYALLNHRQITILFTDCTYANAEWDNTIAELTSTLNNKKHPSTALRVGCAGPVEWKRI